MARKVPHSWTMSSGGGSAEAAPEVIAARSELYRIARNVIARSPRDALAEIIRASRAWTIEDVLKSQAGNRRRGCARGAVFLPIAGLGFKLALTRPGRLVDAP